MARRSFDIGRKPEPESKPRKKKRRAKEPEKKSQHPRLATRAPKRKLRDRRREAFFQKAVLIVIAAGLVVGGTVYALWRPEVRIQSVAAEGFGDPDALAAIAKAELKGTYGGIFPRDSFFFYPERAIREAILDEYPGVSSMSITRTGFGSLLIRTSERAAAFWWCGSPANLSAREGGCYDADAEGLVFSLASIETASSTGKEMLHVFAELDTASSTGTYPLRARVEGWEKLPDILKFARSIQALGTPIASVAIRGDEADLFIAPSTRITYVVGHEKAATETAKAAFPNLNLMNGSIEYVDLRFDGKVYLKRRGE